MTTAATRFSALVLAGTRPGGDPFAQAMHVPYKAMVLADGVPLLRRVVDALRESPFIERIVVIGMEAEAVLRQPQLAELLQHRVVEVLPGAVSPASSVLSAIDSGSCAWPILVTTGDHALLTTALVNEFCAQATGAAADVVAGIVDAARVRAAYPGVRRTFTRFRDGSYKGTNLFALLTPDSRRAAVLWTEVEQYRKQPWRMISFLGLGPLLRFVLGRATLDEMLQLIAARMQLRLRTALLSVPEAALDVDSVAHLQLAEEILRRRARAAER